MKVFRQAACPVYNLMSWTLRSLFDATKKFFGEPEGKERYFWDSPTLRAEVKGKIIAHEDMMYQLPGVSGMVLTPAKQITGHSVAIHCTIRSKS
jgi:hypothetical protein